MLKSIFRHTCPRCHTGKLYLVNNPYNFSKLGQMPPQCPHCGQSYSPEPGFYFGATYVSYGFAVAYFVIAFAINYTVFKAEFYTAFTVIAAIFALLTPIVFRLSRAVWIHFFVRFNKEAKRLGMDANLSDGSSV